MAALSPELAAFISSSRAISREMLRLSTRQSVACVAALGDAAVQAAPSLLGDSAVQATASSVQAAPSKRCGVGGDPPTAAPPSRGAKRPSEAADTETVVKCARRGTAHSSRYYGVSWMTSHGKWLVAYYDLDGRHVNVGFSAVEGDAARTYNAAVIRANLAHIRPLNLEKDGVLLEKPEKTSEFRGISLNVKNNRWQAIIRRGKRHGLDGRVQRLGFFEDERDAGLAVDSFARLHLPGTALNFPTLDELYVSRLKVPLRVRLTYDVSGGRREVIAAQLTKVKYDPSHKSVEKRGVWRYRVKLEDAQTAKTLGLQATFWDPVTGDHSRFAACDYRQAAPRQKGPSARKKATPVPKAASALSRSSEEPLQY
ncbi:hypothetical protein M885DRAFT_619949 [Pelagophyceae sp. CCMP2097]|nr:hypothetical protein M885DRAFT_619949 [Pelagophyceae sp. CCMP2097]